jgi:hypothetical protein
MSTPERPPYVRVRWPLRQAEAVEKALARAAEGKAKSHAEQKALAALRRSLASPTGGHS